MGGEDDQKAKAPKVAHDDLQDLIVELHSQQLPASRKRTWREPALIATVLVLGIAWIVGGMGLKERGSLLEMGLYTAAGVGMFVAYALYQLELTRADREWRWQRRQILAARARHETER